MSDNTRCLGMALIMFVALWLLLSVAVLVEQNETAIDPTSLASIVMRLVVIIAGLALVIIPNSIVLYFDWWME